MRVRVYLAQVYLAHLLRPASGEGPTAQGQRAVGWRPVPGLPSLLVLGEAAPPARAGLQPQRRLGSPVRSAVGLRTEVTPRGCTWAGGATCWASWVVP